MTRLRNHLQGALNAFIDGAVGQFTSTQRLPETLRNVQHHVLQECGFCRDMKARSSRRGRKARLRSHGPMVSGVRYSTAVNSEGEDLFGM